jgi:hypothetical protein
MRLAFLRRGLAGALALSCARARRKEGRNRMRVGFHGGCRHVGFFTADEREPLDRDRTDVGGPQPKRARPRSDNFLIWAYQTHRNFRFPPFSWILVNGQVIGFWIEQKN